MPDLDVIFPGESRKWKWMVSKEELEELDEMKEELEEE